MLSDAQQHLGWDDSDDRIRALIIAISRAQHVALSPGQVRIDAIGEYPQEDIHTFISAGATVDLVNDMMTGLMTHVIFRSGNACQVKFAFEHDFGVAPSAPSECPECWGTGYLNGFGLPCSKGCKAP